MADTYTTDIGTKKDKLLDLARGGVNDQTGAIIDALYHQRQAQQGGSLDGFADRLVKSLREHVVGKYLGGNIPNGEGGEETVMDLMDLHTDHTGARREIRQAGSLDDDLVKTLLDGGRQAEKGLGFRRFVTYLQAGGAEEQEQATEWVKEQLTEAGFQSVAANTLNLNDAITNMQRYGVWERLYGRRKTGTVAQA